MTVPLGSMPAAAITFRQGAGLGIELIRLGETGPGLVRVDIKATGVCHSDLHIVDGDWPTDRPLVLGHEASGVVAEIGAGVRDVQVGDHVVLSWFAPCGRCVTCASGQAWLCSGTTAIDNTLPDGSTGFTDDDGLEVWPYLGLGTFTDSVLVPESAVIVVSDELPFEVGALLGCSVTTGVGAVVNTASVPVGSVAVVIGCGGVGLSIIMGLKLVGANPIIAVDLSPEKLAIAEELGATVVLRGDEVDVPAHLQEHYGGADFAFEAIGRIATIESLPSMLSAGGSAVLVGMTPVGARASIDPFDLADQGKSILGCNYGSSVAKRDIPRLADLYLAGLLPLDKLIGLVRPLSDASSALDELRAGVGLRSILVPAGREEELQVARPAG